jgi:hypothetical protein
MVDIRDMDQDVDPSWVVSLPGTVAWETHRRESPNVIKSFIDMVESAEKADKFPWILVSHSNRVPLAPIGPIRSQVYARIVNCVEEESRPESKWKQPREVGDFNISDASHRLVHQAVAIVSQMQVIATANNYELELDKFERDKPTMRVLGSGNAIIVGLMTVLVVLKSIGDQHESMRTYRRSLIHSRQLDEREMPDDFEYRLTCTRYLEIKIMQMLVRSVANICVRSDEIDAFDCLEDGDIWNSQLMRVWLWDQVIGVAMKVDEEFKSSNYPFIESYTMNVRRDRPMFQDHFTAHAALARIRLNPDETGVLKCTGTYDMDLPELQR